MSIARVRRRSTGQDYWPGFVDAMATLLLVVTFLLSLFMVVQFFVSQESSKKDNVLAQLNAQIAQLTELLQLERSSKRGLEDSITTLSATLESTRKEKARLESELSEASGRTSAARKRAEELSSELDQQVRIGADALAQVEILNQQLAALRRQIAALEDALEASEARDRESQARIADLGKRLNLALARKV
ncbi:MAG: peptidoglycan-binding protein, partial [Alphaproteobacteria bacterium]